MKRLLSLAAAVIFGTAALHKDIEDAECRQQHCASELTAKVPDQPHTPEEPPEYRMPEGWIEIQASPPYMVEIGSPSHLEYLEWLKQNGAAM